MLPPSHRLERESQRPTSSRAAPWGRSSQLFPAHAEPTRRKRAVKVVIVRFIGDDCSGRVAGGLRGAPVERRTDLAATRRWLSPKFDSVRETLYAWNFMKIRDRFAAEPRTFSFEFSPPRTAEAIARLFETAERLRELAPTFVSVTYRAGGPPRRNTIDVVSRLQHELGLTAAAHLTCVGHAQQELAELLQALAARGIENLMLLRGDPPRD